MKKLTAIAAFIAALSIMVSCGNNGGDTSSNTEGAESSDNGWEVVTGGDTADSEKSAEETASNGESAESTESASDSDANKAGIEFEKSGLTYELDFSCFGEKNQPTPEEIDDCVAVAMKQIKALKDGDIDAFKGTIDFDTLNLTELFYDETDFNEVMAEEFGGFKTLIQYDLADKIKCKDAPDKVYVMEDVIYENGFSENAIVLNFPADDGSDDALLYVFVMIYKDGKSSGIVLELMDKATFAEVAANYQATAEADDLNRNAKLAYNVAAEYAADLEVQGKKFEIPDAEFDLSSKGDSELSEKLYNAFDSRGETPAGFVYIGKAKINDVDTFYAQWKETADSTDIGQYPDEISADNKGKATWGKYFEPQA